MKTSTIKKLYLVQQKRGAIISALLFVMSFLILQGGLSQPVISSFSPLSGPVGTAVTITGNNFDAVPSDNVVFFGAVKANVIASSLTSITVTVPKSATYQPISVTSRGLTSYAAKPFGVTFSSVASFSANSFAIKKDITSGTNPNSVASGDLNGDGKPDIVCINNGSYKVSIFRNTGTSGNLTFAPRTDMTTNAAPQSVFVGDVDSDGMPDILVTSISPRTVSIYRNTSVNQVLSFDGKVDLTTGIDPMNVKIGDFDGDGKTDIAVANVNDFSISVFRNTGTKGNISFAGKVDFSTGSLHAHSIAIGDLDGDGKMDIVASDYNPLNDSISVFKNTGTPGTVSFNSKIDYPKARGDLGISVADLDGDGKLDIATACWQSGKVSVFRNSGSTGVISFAAKVDYATGNLPEGIAITDMDGDGKPDICVTNYSSNSVSLLKNASLPGSLTFEPKIDFTTGINPKGLVIVDLDGDGKPDITTANVNSNDISILRNIITGVVRLCPGGNGTITTNLMGNNYQWQQSTDSIKFSNISDNANRSGTSTVNLNLNNVPSSWYGYQYRCVIDAVTNDELFVIQFSNNWTGSLNSSWEDPANWSCGSLPDANTDVIIDSGTVVLNSNTTIRSLSLNPGASFTVTPGYTLTITH